MHKLKLYNEFCKYIKESHPIDFPAVDTTWMDPYVKQQQIIDKLRIDEQDLQIYAAEVIHSLIGYFNIDYVKEKLEELVEKTITTVFAIHPSYKHVVDHGRKPFAYIFPYISNGEIELKDFIPPLCTMSIINKKDPTIPEIWHCMDMVVAFNNVFTWGDTRRDRIRNCFENLKYSLRNSYPGYRSQSDFICEYDDLKNELKNESDIKRYSEYIKSSAEEIFGPGWKISADLWVDFPNVKIELHAINTNKK